MENGRLAPELREAVQAVALAIKQRMPVHIGPLVVAIDGGSGAGKSTLAAVVSPQVELFLLLKVESNQIKLFPK